MQNTETRKTKQSEAVQLPSGWWLIPSAVCGASIWAAIIAALLR